MFVFFLFFVVFFSVGQGKSELEIKTALSREIPHDENDSIKRAGMGNGVL